jgi:O-succinylbenzoic acid--CoA ligase
VTELVAIDLPLGEQLVATIADVLAAGDALTVLDPRWGAETRAQALAALRPTRMVDAEGWRPLLDGTPADEGDALVVLSSGSIASPKAAVLTLPAVVASAELTSLALGVDPARHRWLACLPPSHIGGLSVILRALVTGTPLSVIGEPTEGRLSEAAAAGATHVSLVARLLRRIDPADFERIVLGGAAPPEDRPPNAIATYGMTETGSGVVYDGSPLPGVAVAVDAPDEVGVGEVLVSSPTLLRSYRDRPAPLVTGPDGTHGWLATGDLGRIGADGLLEVRGRAADVIVTGGEKVYPEDVEAVISRLASVAEVAVARRPDAEWGHRVVAFIVPVGEGPSLDEVRGVVGEALGRFAAPKEIELVSSLPRTALGKIRRSVLS